MPAKTNAPRNPMRPLPREKDEYLSNPPGSLGWFLEKRLRNQPIRFDTSSYWNSLDAEEQEKLTKILRDMKSPNQKVRQNHENVKNINAWTNGNNWMMIEGGEHNEQWVNPRYPTITFQSGKLFDITNNDYIYFPIGNSLTDPEGVACHYEVSNGGTKCTILPNKWTPATSLRYHRRKYAHARRRDRKKYLRQQGLDDLAENTDAENFIAKTVKKMKRGN